MLDLNAIPWSWTRAAACRGRRPPGGAAGESGKHVSATDYLSARGGLYADEQAPFEFHRLDLDHGWATPEGYPSGIQQKIPASDIDERRKTGSRSRLLRFEPGVYTTAPFVHDHREEVYLLSGDLTVGNDAKGQGGESFQAPPRCAVHPALLTARSNLKAAACCSKFTTMTKALQQ